MHNDEFLDLLTHITDGGSIDDWLQRHDIRPSQLKLYLENTTGANDQLKKAASFRSDYLFESLISASKLCDDIDKNHVPAHKLKIDTIKWLLSVQDPEKFTSKISTTTSGGGEVIILDTGIRRDSDDEPAEEGDQ